MFDELVLGIVDTVADYRRDDGVAITGDHVAAWATQFHGDDVLAVLRETRAVLEARYVSKASAFDFLESVLRELARQNSGSDLQRTLAETAFLDIQVVGKSQGALLTMLDEIVGQYGYRVADCGGRAPKRYIYLDDVLCTGATLFRTMKSWWLAPDCSGFARQDSLPKNVTVQYVFIALHRRYWSHVVHRFAFDTALLSRATPRMVSAALRIQNDRSATSALDFAFPRRVGLPRSAELFFRSLNVSSSHFFREEERPAMETLFTSAQGRNSFERAILAKGIEIVQSLGNDGLSGHPLGFTFAAEKSFGFGALVFTWRNVPNNSPLVFWHDAPQWTPLFKRRSASNIQPLATPSPVVPP